MSDSEFESVEFTVAELREINDDGESEASENYDKLTTMVIFDQLKRLYIRWMQNVINALAIFLLYA